jgi:hypothetical protein
MTVAVDHRETILPHDPPSRFRVYRGYLSIDSGFIVKLLFGRICSTRSNRSSRSIRRRALAQSSMFKGSKVQGRIAGLDDDFSSELCALAPLREISRIKFVLFALFAVKFPNPKSDKTAWRSL